MSNHIILLVIGQIEANHTLTKDIFIECKVDVRELAWEESDATKVDSAVQQAIGDANGQQVCVLVCLRTTSSQPATSSTLAPASSAQQPNTQSIKYIDLEPHDKRVLECLCALNHRSQTNFDVLGLICVDEHTLHDSSTHAEEWCLGHGVLLATRNLDEIFSHVLHLQLPLTNTQTGLTPPPPDLFEGSIVGVAIGDAVGAMIEGFGQSQALEYSNKLASSLSSYQTQPAYSGRTPGGFTDDTQNTRELIISLLRSPFSLHDFASRLTLVFVEDRYTGIGGTSLAAFQALQPLPLTPNSSSPNNQTHVSSSCPLDLTALWLKAGFVRPAPTNGSCMRSAPIGLVAWAASDLDIVRLSVLHSHVTHIMPSCKAACAAVASAIQSSIRLRSLGLHPVESFISNLTHSVSPTNTQTSTLDDIVASIRVQVIKAVHRTTSLIDPSINYKNVLEAMLLNESSLEAALKVLKTQIPMPSPFNSMTVDWTVSSYAPHTTIWALFCFLKTPHDFWRALFDCLAVGGDTDTTASITGAVSGAFNGLCQMRHPPLTLATRPMASNEHWPSVIGNMLCCIRDPSTPAHPSTPQWKTSELRALACSLHRKATSLSLSLASKPQQKIQELAHALRDAKSKLNVVFIGISGASCSGKTSFANQLNMSINEQLQQQDGKLDNKTKLPCKCVVIQHDLYFLVDELRQQIDSDWEDQRFIDHCSLLRDVALTASSLKSTTGGGVIIVEGYRSFHPDAHLKKLFDSKIWIEVNEEAAKERRKDRRYKKAVLQLPLDYETKIWPHIWGAHCEYSGELQKDQMLKVDGNESAEKVLAVAHEMALTIAADFVSKAHQNGN